MNISKKSLFYRLYACMFNWYDVRTLPEKTSICKMFWQFIGLFLLTFIIVPNLMAVLLPIVNMVCFVGFSLLQILSFLGGEYIDWRATKIRGKALNMEHLNFSFFPCTFDQVNKNIPGIQVSGFTVYPGYFLPLIPLYFWPVVTLIVIGSIVALIGFVSLLYKFGISEFCKMVIGYLKAKKNRVCFDVDFTD